MKTSRLFKWMLIASTALEAVKRIGGEEAVKFLLDRFQSQSAPTETPAETAASNTDTGEQRQNGPMPEPEPEPEPVVLVHPTPVVPPQPATSPARVPEGIEAIPKSFPVILSPFAAKLNGAAKNLGLEDKSPLAQFKKALSNRNGRGPEYWDNCRNLLTAVLSQKLLEEGDWKLLVGVMKRNLFFTDEKNSRVFLSSCPKDILSDLVISQDGLSQVVGKIAEEANFNRSSIYRLKFIMDACEAVGKEADILLERCKKVVQRFKEQGFIKSDHWLVRKASARRRLEIPQEKYASPPEVVRKAETAPLNPTAENLDPDSMSIEQLEALTAPDVDKSDKPDRIDPEYQKAFAEMMLEEEPATVQ